MHAHAASTSGGRRMSPCSGVCPTCELAQCGRNWLALLLCEETTSDSLTARCGKYSDGGSRTTDFYWGYARNASSKG